MSAACELPASPPLVSLIVLTCSRPGFLRLALASAANQSYPAIEAIVVDDGKHSDSLSTLRSLAPRVTIRRVRLSSRRSIGEKRNAGVRMARGHIVMHWDDDDVRHTRHVATLACPILRNWSDVTCLTFSFLARLSTSSVSFYAYTRAGHGAALRSATGPFLGSLAYTRSAALSLPPAESEPARAEYAERAAHGRSLSGLGCATLGRCPLRP
jgi:glycosyltransferase involved in cell wall biosynthesis